MVLSWFQSRRRQRLLSEPFPHEWRRVLEQRVRHYAYLDSERRSRLEEFVQVVRAEKDWAGGSGFELNDEIKVTIAGFAAVMTLGLPEPYYFDRLETIIVYRGAYVTRASRYDIHSIHQPSANLGESWHRGPVILSWSEIIDRQSRPTGTNLVFHEFAHHVDGLDGDMDGMPPIVGSAKRRSWRHIAEHEFERLQRAAMQGQASLLDTYGASSRPEFFAVASECFFERPHAMRERHTELYEALADFYCQDPTTWLPDAISQQPPTDAPHERHDDATPT